MAKKYSILTIVVMVWASCLVYGQPSQDRSHLLNPTRPASTGRGSLRRSQAELDYQTGNLLITGNVAGNRYFRGNVPYGSEYDFRGSLGSDDLNDFIRRSADPIYDRTPGVYTPYFLPSQTVTTLRRGTASGLQSPQLFSPITPQVSETPRPFGQVPVTGTRDYFTGTTDELERELSLQISLLQVNERDRADLLRPETAVDEVADQITREEIRPQRLLDEGIKPEVKSPVTEQQQRRFDEQLEPLEPVKPLEPLTPDKLVEMYEQNIELRERSKALREGELEEQEQEIEGVPQPEAEQELKEGEGAKEEMELTPEQKARAREILKEYGSFEAFARQRFEKHMQRAKEMMDKRKFYAASDAFDLAMIYNRTDPAVYAGKSLALFAAGDYISSSYLLQRAIKLDPQVAQKPVDLQTVLGGSARLDQRMKDLTRWYSQTKTPELALLLTYVYYQLGDLDKAATTVEQARDSLPDGNAVEVLRNVISEKAKGSEQGS